MLLSVKEFVISRSTLLECELWQRGEHNKERTKWRRWDACRIVSYLALHIQFFSVWWTNSTGEDKQVFSLSVSFPRTHTHTQMSAAIGFILICPSVIICNGSVGSPWRVSYLSIYHACFTLSMSSWENWFYIHWPSWIIWAKSFFFWRWKLYRKAQWRNNLACLLSYIIYYTCFLVIEC